MEVAGWIGRSGAHFPLPVRRQGALRSIGNSARTSRNSRFRPPGGGGAGGRSGAHFPLPVRRRGARRLIRNSARFGEMARITRLSPLFPDYFLISRPGGPAGGRRGGAGAVT